ncbi:MAG: LpxI family protein [Firmicutes bacterium]|nr:LpxI family protein [Bacillota bacterium]
MPTIAILAGKGNLPLVAAQGARAQGYRVIVVGLLGEVAPELARLAHANYPVTLGQWQSIIDILKMEKVQDVYLIGGVSKGLLFGNLHLDERIRRLLAGLGEKNDNAVIEAFVDDLAREGMTVRPQIDLLQEIMPGPGVLTNGQPSSGAWADIRYGWRIAKAIAGLDIGQTVVVKDGAVLAVEAIDGTDATISRGGRLAQGGGVVVKVAKPAQDMRFDLPTIGQGTLQTAIEAGIQVIALEAGKTLVMDRDALIRQADAAGVAIVLVDEQEMDSAGVNPKQL